MFVKLPAANVFHRKARTAATVTAVAVEVAAVMLLVGLANGTLEDIAKRLQNTGADIFFMPSDTSFLLGSGSALLPLRDTELIRTLPGVKAVSPVLMWHLSRLKEQARALNLWGVDYPSFAAISGGLPLHTGHPPVERNDLAIDAGVAQTAGLRVGDVLPLLRRDFRVAGIFSARAGARLYVRLEDLQEATGAKDQASFFLIQANRPGDADQVAAGLRKRFPGSKIEPASGISRDLERSTLGLQQFEAAVMGLAATVSFFVVLLAMYSAVLERTREIGILKALGATPAQILRLVVAEGSLICVAGTSLGFVLALGGRSCLLFLFPTQAVTLSLRWAAIAAAVGLFGGLLGAIHPACRAARMAPVDALRFE